MAENLNYEASGSKCYKDNTAYCEDSDDFLYGRKKYFQRIGEAGYWWSSYEFGSSTSCYRAMTNLGNSTGWSSIGKGGYFYSVRCLQDTALPKGTAK